MRINLKKNGHRRMWKLFLLSIVFICIGCSTTTPIIVEKMVISPDTVVFNVPDSATTVSITHTCTCPFSWTGTVLPDTIRWLVTDTNFPSSQSGDKSDVPLSINRWLLNRASDTAKILILSNAYGEDTITVIAIK